MSGPLALIDPQGSRISCPSCEADRFYRFESFCGTDIVNIYTSDGISGSRDGNDYNAEWDGDWSCENDHPVDETTSDLLDELYERGLV